jgi:hypothetical protein
LNLSKPIDSIIKRLRSVEERNSKDNSVKTKEEGKAEDRARYQEMKRKYELHHDYENRNSDYGVRYLPNNAIDGGFARYVGKSCNSVSCVLECPFWAEDGYMSEDGNVYYEDPNFDEEFYGTDNAIQTRKKIAAMSPKEYEKYKQELIIRHTTPG